MQEDVCVCARKWAPTWILPSFISVDKAGDQHNECEESDGAHQADKPALGGYPSVNAGQTWGEQNPVTLPRLGLFWRDIDWMFTISKAYLIRRQGGDGALRWWKSSNINIKQLMQLV